MNLHYFALPLTSEMISHVILMCVYSAMPAGAGATEQVVDAALVKGF